MEEIRFHIKKHVMHELYNPSTGESLPTPVGYKLRQKTAWQILSRGEIIRTTKSRKAAWALAEEVLAEALEPCRG